MKSSKHRLYVGVDVRKTTHRTAIIPLDLLEGSGNDWKAVKPFSLGNNKNDFERLDAAIRDRISDADNAVELFFLISFTISMECNYPCPTVIRYRLPFPP